MLILATALGAVIPFSYKAYDKMRFTKACARIDGELRQKRLEALMQDKDLPLSVIFEGEMTFNKESVSVVHFLFYSNGSVRPEGTLLLRRGIHVSLLEIT